MSDPTFSAASVALSLLCCFVSISEQTIPSDDDRIEMQRLSCLCDQDQDGLDDALEIGQHSAPDLVDTDDDGWNDAEELARGSLSTVNGSRPEVQPCSIGAGAYMRDGRLHVALATYIRSGSLEGASFDVGVFARWHMILLDPSRYAQQATLTSVPTHDPGELLIVTDIVIPHALLLRTGSMPIYATLKLEGIVRSATAIQLVLQEGTPVVLIEPAQVSPSAHEQLGPGLLRRPLGGVQVPSSWSSGEICFQRLEQVGAHGALLTQEITSSECVSGWDGYCDAGTCTSSVGTTVDLVDPAALIGG